NVHTHYRKKAGCHIVKPSAQQKTERKTSYEKHHQGAGSCQNTVDCCANHIANGIYHFELGVGNPVVYIFFEILNHIKVFWIKKGLLRPCTFLKFIFDIHSSFYHFSNI